MPEEKDTTLDELMAGVDEALATSEGVEPWPANGSREEKQVVLARVRDRKATPDQVAVLQQALASNEDVWLSSEIMSTLLWCTGHETRRDDSRSYPAARIDAVYEEALGAAASTLARIALHRGYASYSPAGSTTGMLRGEDAERLARHLGASRDPAEQRVLVDLLRNRAGYDEARLLEALNTMLDNPSRTITNHDLILWERAVSKVAAEQSWRKDGVLLDASQRLTRYMWRLSDTSSLITALAFLSGEGFRKDLSAVFLGHAAHAEPSVRRAAIPGLVKLGDQGRAKLISMVSEDTDQDVLEAVWTSLEKSGSSQLDLIRLISNHTNCTLSVRVVLQRLSRRHGGAIWDPMQTLWPCLKPSLRDAIRRTWRQDVDLVEQSFHHPGWWDLMHELRHRTGEGVSGLAAMSWLTRPFDDVLGSVDFEQVSGLRREFPVEIRSVDILRFSYLADASDRHGQSLGDLLHRSDLSVEELIAEEDRYDLTRDRLSRLRHELDQYAAQVGSDVLAELRRGDAGDERSVSRRVRDRLGELGDRHILELVREVERLSKDAGFQSGGEQFYRLFNATKRLIPTLREVGVSFDGLVGPDGILGEYQPVDKSVTLFGPMIDLAADAVARQLGRPESEVSPLVRTVVEVHELAHAHLHLGRDARGGIWDTPGAGSIAHHEAVAQAYTRRLLAGMDLPGMKDVLSVMEGWLSPEYRYADLLDPMDAEDLRTWVVTARKARASVTLEAVAGTVAQTLPGYLSMLAGQISLRAFRHTTEDLQGLLSRPAPHVSPDGLVELLTVVGALPNVTTILGVFLPGGWPTPDRLAWLRFESRIAGPPVGERPLRFIKHHGYVRAVSATPPVAVAGPLPSLEQCASALEALRTAAGQSQRIVVGKLPRRRKS